jgi:hypothetical protein
MAARNRKSESQERNLFVIKTPRRRVWFLNGDLIRVKHVSRAAGLVTFENLTKDRLESITLIEFRKKRKRAFTTKETAKLLNFHPKSLPRLVKNGMIDPPVGVLPNGERKYHYMSWYCEDSIREARRVMAQIHHGAARKDGLVTNNKIPTEQELTYMMGGGTILYAKNSDGEFVPVYSETL